MWCWRAGSIRTGSTRIRSHELVRSGHWHTRNGVVAPGIRLGRERLVGRQEQFPGQALTGISCFAREDRHPATERSTFAIVDWFTCADAGEELVVLDLIHVLTLNVIYPQLATNGCDGVLHELSLPLCAKDVVIDVRGATCHLSAGREELHTAGELECAGKVVVDIAILR